MDNFTIEIDVQSYVTILDGRKVYRKGQTWEFVAGRDLSVAQIRRAVEENYYYYFHTNKARGEPAIGTPSPMTRQRAAAMAIASSPPSASTRSKTAAASPLKH